MDECKRYWESRIAVLQGWPGSSGSFEFSWGKHQYIWIKQKLFPKRWGQLHLWKGKKNTCSVASSSHCFPLVLASGIPVVVPKENNGFRRLPYVYSAISWKKDLINASVSVSPWVKSNRVSEESQSVWNLLVSNVCFAVVSLKVTVEADKITSRS